MKLTLWDHETQLLHLIQAVADAGRCGKGLQAEEEQSLKEYATQALHKHDRIMVQMLREMERLEQALRAEADMFHKRAVLIATTREQLEQYVLSVATVNAALDLSNTLKGGKVVPNEEEAEL